MMPLLVLRENLKNLYAKYDIYIIPILKFILTFSVFMVINANIGFMPELKKFFPGLILGLICSFLSWGGITAIVSSYVLLHLYSLSFEIALLVGVCLLIIAIIYYSFKPGDSVLLIITPMLFFLRVPYILPLIVGLSGSLITIIPVCFGVFLYYVLLYVKQNASVIINDAAADITQKYVQIMKGMFSNKMIVIMMAAFAVSILFVYIIKNLSFDYSWMVAVITGTVVQLVILFLGNYVFSVTIPVLQLIIGVAVSVVLSLLYVLCVFSVDYTRTEYTQFEDDDYYYYVKAVPKMAVSAPDRRVKRINSRK